MTRSASTTITLADDNNDIEWYGDVVSYDTGVDDRVK
jgi:hypothetical protein